MAKIKVSKHAVHRYMQRVKGMSPIKAKQQILEAVGFAIPKRGEVKIPVSDECVAVVTNRVVVTILPKKDRRGAYHVQSVDRRKEFKN